MNEVQKIELRAALAEKHPDLCEIFCDLNLEELEKIVNTVMIRRLIDKQFINNEEDYNSLDIICELYADGGIHWVAMQSFNFGRIQGIRAERSRRKARAI